MYPKKTPKGETFVLAANLEIYDRPQNIFSLTMIKLSTC